MNTVVEPGLRHLQARESAIAGACARIAPAWPLDEAIAVNPWWGWRGLPIERVDAVLGRLAGAALRMPLAWYREQWRAGAFSWTDLRAVASSAQEADALRRMLEGTGEAPPPARIPLVTDLVDAPRELGRAMAWRQFVLQHVSQQCAAYFDRHQSAWHPTSGDGLYASWRAFAVADRSATALLDAPGVAERLRGLPLHADATIEFALEQLGWREADPQALEAYLTAVLASVQGWAAWAAWLRWQDDLRGGAQEDAGALRELLAIRLAWEAVLAPMAALPPDWHVRWRAAASARPAFDTGADWKLQAAIEHAYQAALAKRLLAPRDAPAAAVQPDVLAVFCIDVRSEPMRRALEAAGGERVRTAGFAGFFGLPIAHAPLGAHTPRPQLPGLLAPARTTEEAVESASLGQALRARRRREGAWREAWRQLRSGPSSTFSYVEALGAFAAGRLLMRSLHGGARDPAPPASRPRLAPCPGATPAEELRERRDLVAGILRAMGLAAPGLQWPALVLLAGHGSRSANNPFAATLDCGACGGQTGEVNARVLAGLLNDDGLRETLAGIGIAIPATTRFIAGVHWTSTDEVSLYDEETLPAGARPALAALRAWLDDASRRVRAERAPALGLDATDPHALLQAVTRRARDWSQVRPEWGLAGNAAFIVAPRERTRGLDLQGRSFLHDYDWRTDDGFGVLELVMTAPMVVANWINLQYMASVVDPVRWGSGSKTLHNVVGGRIGVFEGNGGDLRIGLPWQSVHDGTRFVHTPLRLSVFIEAPQDAIDDVIARHEVVRDLADHGWLHLHCIVPGTGRVLQRRDGTWSALLSQADHGARAACEACGLTRRKHAAPRDATVELTSLPRAMPKRILLLQGHPDRSQRHLLHALADSYADAARAAGHDLRLVDIAALEFPLLRSQADWEHGTLPAGLVQAQQDIGWCEHMLLFFPLWLGDMPALVKGFLEQVARPGFAFEYKEGGSPFNSKGLAGRSARVVVTMGMPAAVYRWYFRAHSVKSLERNILGFVGIAPVDETLIGTVGNMKPQDVASWQRKLAQLGTRGE